MKKILNEIIYDAEFIKGHTLQPGWYKVLKVFLILGFLTGFFFLFGGHKLLVFCLIFFSCALIIHFLYLTMTKRYTRSWLDFKIAEIDGNLEYQRIGIYYYLMVIASLALAVVVSLLVL